MDLEQRFGGAQPWDLIRDTRSWDEYVAWQIGVIQAYLLRAGAKGDAKEDIAKSGHHMQKLVEDAIEHGRKLERNEPAAKGVFNED